MSEMIDKAELLEALRGLVAAREKIPISRTGDSEIERYLIKAIDDGVILGFNVVIKLVEGW